MAIIYVYKFVDNKYIDVFEADTLGKEFSENGDIMPKQYEWRAGSKNVKIEFGKCLLDSSGKGSGSGDLIIYKTATAYHNVLWLHEYNIAKAVEIFKKHNDDKIIEYKDSISKLEEYNRILDKYKS